LETHPVFNKRPTATRSGRGDLMRTASNVGVGSRPEEKTSVATSSSKTYSSLHIGMSVPGATGKHLRNFRRKNTDPSVLHLGSYNPRRKENTLTFL